MSRLKSTNSTNSPSMIQLDLFTQKEIEPKEKRSRGRPAQITGAKVLEITDAIKANEKLKKNKLTNQQLCEKHNISSRTFYRIKKIIKKEKDKLKESCDSSRYEKSLNETVEQIAATFTLSMSD